MTTLELRDLRLGYDGREAVAVPSLRLEEGTVVAVIGPNGSGKSTLLRGMARALKPRGGAVLLDGRAIASLPPKAVARVLALLPQSPTAPPDVSVEELVWRGRHPHLGFFGVPKAVDREAVEWALAATSLQHLRQRPLSTLSGGERQRAWIAMALAQQPRLLLLDEPTTYLDIGHQLEVLELLAALNRDHGLTLVLVLQDLNHASRFAHRLLVLRGGAIVADGPPASVLTEQLLREVFGVEAEILPRGEGPPVVLPLRAAGPTP